MRDAEVPVLVLDVTESEADKILATFDPIGAMAEANASKLEELLREVQTGNEALAEMLADLAEENNLITPDFEPGTEDDQGQLDELSPKIVTCPHCKTEFDCREQI